MISAALVARDGSIDWLCLPRFDSPACFAALLGDSENGRWIIAPTDPPEITRSYYEGTAVLETRFATRSGEAALIDFMPQTDDEDKVDVVRIVRGIRGSVDFGMELVLRFAYGTAVPWVQRRDYGLSAVAGPDAVELHTLAKLKGRDLKTRAQFRVSEGDSVPFTLSYHPSHKTPHFVPDTRESLNKTMTTWRAWSKRCLFDSKHKRWNEAVIRSAITLKMLHHATTGGIVAAPTTSLPEKLGGSHNWDYRYCWIRDSAMTLYAMLNAGYREEAESWRRWLLRAAAGHPEQLRIMYGISGERWLPELELPWLSGYENSSPVRIGNLASSQRQLDVYGELIDVLHAARDAELAAVDEAWALQKTLLKGLERAWKENDHGIWETRGPARAFTHSRVMSWVAFDRGVKSCERFGLDGPVDRWREIRAEIHEDVCANAFDPKRNTFVQSYGARELDAALLLIPQTGFLPANDPRIAGTVAAIERELASGDGLVMRYTKDADAPGREGAFLICSFWLADAYVMLGRIDDATRVFESVLELRNDLGLLSEEYDPDAKRLIGNFPQGFSHIGLVNTAFNLVKAQGPAQQRSERVAPTARDGGSAANAGRHLRPTARDGGSAANAGRHLRPTK
jgi:GH15 family glucan-1,4-alpha-glucosidase